ncbi:MAG: 50S ribosomal protein L31 [Candidatus Blackburnbacteria bacterium]|nr:50S ribosomal protein L31 [Candidatus Blackburnbacteria bacterium]
MKAQIHPTWYPEAKVSCACGNTFTVGSTVPEIHVEVCSRCHPFYTGKTRYIDTAGRVDKFREKLEGVSEKALSKKEKRALKRKQKIEEELSRPTTLSELRR